MYDAISVVNYGEQFRVRKNITSVSLTLESLMLNMYAKR